MRVLTQRSLVDIDYVQDILIAITTEIYVCTFGRNALGNDRVIRVNGSCLYMTY